MLEDLVYGQEPEPRKEVELPAQILQEASALILSAPEPIASEAAALTLVIGQAMAYRNALGIAIEMANQRFLADLMARVRQDHLLAMERARRIERDIDALEVLVLFGFLLESKR